jgi:hypothetical protein
MFSCMYVTTYLLPFFNVINLKRDTSMEIFVKKPYHKNTVFDVIECLDKIIREIRNTLYLEV